MAEKKIQLKFLKNQIGHVLDGSKTLEIRPRSHLHQFSIPDSGKIKKDEIVYPQRFMCGNPNTTEKEVDAMIEYVRALGVKITNDYKK